MGRKTNFKINFDGQLDYILLFVIVVLLLMSFVVLQFHITGLPGAPREEQTEFDCLPEGNETWDITTAGTCNNTRINMSQALNIQADVTFRDMELDVDSIGVQEGKTLTLENVTIVNEKTEVNGTFIIRNSHGTVWQNDNLVISGSYILDNSVLIINATSDGSIGINVTGSMTIANGSVITNGKTATAQFFFIVQSGATFRMENSFLNQSGWADAVAQRGLEISADNSVITGSTINNSYHGVTLYSDGNIIENSDISSNNPLGIYITSSSNNRIENNTLVNNRKSGVCSLPCGWGGIAIDGASNNNVIIGNTIFNSKKEGITIADADNTLIQNNNISGTDAGPAIGLDFVSSSPTNVRIINLSADDNFYDVQIGGSDEIIPCSSGSAGVLLSDSTMTKTGSNNLLVDCGGSLNVINSSFNSNNVSIVSGTINLKWYLYVNVKDSTNANVNNANVTLYNTTGSVVFSHLTNGAGNIIRENITEYAQTQSGKSFYTPYTLNVTKSGFNTYTQSLNITAGVAVSANITDITTPTVTLLAPTNTTYTSLTVSLQASASETIDKWSYELNGAPNQTFTPNTTITASEGSNTIKVFANDSVNHIGSAQISFSVDSDTSAPVVTLISPGNKTGDNDGNVTLTYNVSDTSSIVNCSLYINNVRNQTDTTITKDIDQTFTLNNLARGRYNWSVSCTDNSYSKSTGSSLTWSFSIIFKSKFGGDSTSLASIDVTSIDNFILENTSSGKINFTQNVNLAGGADIDTFVDITLNNIVVTSANISQLNKTAILTLTNLPYQFKPVPLKNGAICGAQCSIISYSAGSFVFNVSGFTSYSTTANSNLTIYDSSDDLGGNIFIRPGNTMNFYANYTNKTSGLPITGAYCEIKFNVGGWSDLVNMSYTTPPGLYTYSRSFDSTGTYDWNVTCVGASQGYETASAVDTAPVLDICDVPPTADWNINETCTKSGTTLVIAPNHKLNVQSGGSLTLNNVTLYMNSTADYVSAINVYNGGFLNITNSSSIVAWNNANEYNFTIGQGAVFEMKNSFVQDMTKLTSGAPVVIENNTFTYVNGGLYFNSTAGGSNITKNTITPIKELADIGIQIINSNNYRVINNTITNIGGGSFRGTETAIYLSNSHNNSVIDNTANSNIGGTAVDVTTIGLLLEYCVDNTVAGNSFTSANSGAGSAQAFGIKLYGSNQTTITDNTLSSNSGAGNNNQAGLYLDSSHNNTVDSVTANSNGRYGINIESSGDNVIRHSTTSNNIYVGVFFTDSNNNHIYNITSNNNDEGILLYGGSEHNIIENSTTSINSAGGEGSGIHLWSKWGYGVENNSIINNIITGNDQGIWIEDDDSGAGDNIIKNCNLSGNDRGIELSEGTERIVDSIIENSEDYDISGDYLDYYGTSANLYAINTTFTTSYYRYTNYKTYVQWYVDVTANQTSGSVAPSVNITQFNATGSVVKAQLTASNGKTRFNVTEYVQNKTINASQALFTFNATSTGAYSDPTSDNTRSVNVTTTHNTAINFTVPNAYGITINLVAPANNNQTNEGNITFTYNVTSSATINKCDLHYDTSISFSNGLRVTDSSVTKDVNQTFIIELTNNTWYWKVECFSDAASTNSSRYKLILNDVTPGEPELCPNGICDTGETCSSCAADCGTCPSDDSGDSTGGGGSGAPTTGIDVSASGPVTAMLNEKKYLNIDVRNLGESVVRDILVSIGNCPAGWTCETATLPGLEGKSVSRVFLEIKIPLEAEPGTYRLKIIGSSVQSSDEFTLVVVVKGFCQADSECSGDEICKEGLCTPLFDARITRIDSPIEPGEFLDFTYLVKNVAGNPDDYTIEYELVDVASGSEVIFVDSGEEKREIASLFIPTTTEPGLYDFILRLVRGNYAVPARTQIEIVQQAPALLEIELPEIKYDASKSELAFYLELGFNKDRAIPLRLQEKITKDGVLLWQNSRDVNVIKFASIEEFAKNLEPGLYQLEVVAEYEGKTSNIIRTFSVESNIVTLPFLFGEFTITQSIGGVPTVFIMSVVLLVMVVIILMLLHRVITLRKKRAKNSIKRH